MASERSGLGPGELSEAGQKEAMGKALGLVEAGPTAGALIGSAASRQEKSEGKKRKVQSLRIIEKGARTIDGGAHQSFPVRVRGTSSAGRKI